MGQGIITLIWVSLLFLWDILRTAVLRVWVIFRLASFLVAGWLLIINGAVRPIELKSQTTLRGQFICLSLNHCVQVTAMHWLITAEVIFTCWIFVMSYACFLKLSHTTLANQRVTLESEPETRGKRNRIYTESTLARVTAVAIAADI